MLPSRSSVLILFVSWFGFTAALAVIVPLLGWFGVLVAGLAIAGWFIACSLVVTAKDRLLISVGLLLSALTLPFLFQLLDLAITNPYSPATDIELVALASVRVFNGIGGRLSAQIFSAATLGILFGHYGRRLISARWS